MFRGPLYLACALTAIALGSCQRNDKGLNSGVIVEPPSVTRKGGAGGARSGGAGGSANTGGSISVPDAAADTAPDASGDTMPPVDMAKPIDTRPPMVWKPTPGLTWDFQLTNPINSTVAVQVYVIKLFDTLPGVVADLHNKGRKVVCHVDFGSYESWHPDAERIPKEAIGGSYNADPERRWLDIRNQSLMGVMRARLDLAVRLGCDAVAGDNMDGFDTKLHETSGFPLNNIDQLIYNRTIAKEARNRGLAIGLMNDVHQIDELAADFDFHLSEECFSREDCNLIKPFTDAGKPVFAVEYTLELPIFCPMAKTLKFSAIKKKYELDAYREACP
jgi:hypothetical protein